MEQPSDEDRRKQLWKRLLKRFHEACSTYGLLHEEDHILVGLSGGKDSLLLLELLAYQARIARPKLTVEAAHVRMGNVKYETDTTYLERFAAERGVKLHVVETRFDYQQGNKKPVCFLCSWYRRKALFNLAQELGCNKIALGHHQDDLVHTTLMNLFFQGQFAAMPALLQMRKMPLAIIRPLCMEREAEIIEYARLADYQKQVKLCPYEKVSHRAAVAQLFLQIEQMNPEARYSVWNALEAQGKLKEE